MMRFAGWIALLLLVVSCRNQKKEDNGYFLELNLAPGDRFLTTMHIEQDLEAEQNGLPAFIDQYFTFEVLTDVVSSQEGNQFTLTNQYQRIQMQQQITTETDTIHYFVDTGDPRSAVLPSPFLLDYYVNLTKAPYLTEMDRSGNIIKTNLQEVNMAAGGRQYSSPYQHLFTYGVIYPGFKLQVKDTWEKEVNFRDSTISMEGLLTYTLEACDDEKALISMKGRFKSTGKGLEASSKMILEQSGEIWVFRSNGWIKDAAMEQTVRYSQQGGREQVIGSKIQMKGMAVD